MEKIEAVKLLHELRTSGYLTNEEFEQKIAEIVGNGTRLINAKQKYLARHKNKNKKWTDEEDRFILSHKDKSKGWIAKQLGRTRTAIQTRVSVLKCKNVATVKRTYSVWTPQDDEFVIKYRDKLNCGKIAKLLHRTESSIKTRLRDLKRNKKIEASPRKNQSIELDGYILANYGQMTAEEIAKSLHVNGWKIRNQINKLQKEGKLNKKYKKKSDTVQVGENKYPRKYSQMG